MNPIILIYTHTITPRINFILKQLFVGILSIPIEITNNLDFFKNSNHFKIVYNNQPIDDSFFIKSNTLLFEQFINDVPIKINYWNKIPYFFKTNTQSSIPFDIFAASFYLMSRYEEYLPHVVDNYDCFPAEESIAHRFRFLEKPIIDIWTHEMLKEFKKTNPIYNYTPKKYTYISTINVTETYLFKAKGVVRNFVELVYDLGRFNFVKSWTRVMVLLRFYKDPYDLYDEFLQIQEKRTITTIFFFLISKFSKHDQNIVAHNHHFKILIKSIADYCKIGILFSYKSNDSDLIKESENKQFHQITNIPLSKSRQHLLKLKLPITYQTLLEQEIFEDYSMGYLNHIGFRASTCTPFYFYDLNYEIQTPLKIFPISFVDNQFKNQKGITEKTALEKIVHITNEIKSINGTLISVFHNNTLSSFQPQKEWRNFYPKAIQIMKNP